MGKFPNSCYKGTPIYVNNNRQPHWELPVCCLRLFGFDNPVLFTSAKRRPKRPAAC